MLFQVSKSLETNKFLGFKICNKVVKAIKLETMSSMGGIHTSRAQ
jgi:hypothetical protein